MVSVVVGAVGASVLALSLGETALAVVGCAILGVGIDFDHFLIARLRTGSWRSFSDLLRNPVKAFTDQRSIFDDGEVGTIPRLLSHTLLAGVIVGGLAVVSTVGALLAGLVLYAHILCDLVSDYYQLYHVET